MKLSIIIPNYNNGKFLRRCIDSILGQSFRDFELIVVDDGSTDDSKKIINSYNDKRIKTVFQYNQNASIARNRGIEISKGELIYFIDSDDELFDKDTLSKIVDDIGSSDLLLGNYSIINEKDYLLEEYLIKNDNVISTNSVYDYCLISPVPSNKLYRKDLILKNNIYFDNVRIGQDLNFYLKYLSVCKSIKLVDYNIYKYRILESSMSRSDNLNFFDIYNSFLGVKKYYKNAGKFDLYNKYISLVELLHYSCQFNKIRRIKIWKAKRASYKLFMYYFSTINKKECYKKDFYNSIRLKIFVKKIIYFF
ncbi:MAG: glycosyltransferase [Bacilli bacterium]|nr:glycosyltransferase [Bacilli bacterium]